MEIYVQKKKEKRVDLESFVCCYREKDIELREKVINRLESLHKNYVQVRNQIQELDQTTANNEDYITALSRIMGYATIIAKQEDELLDIYCDNIKVETGFYSMLQFEKLLRQADAGDKEIAKKVKSLLNNYRNIHNERDNPTKLSTGLLYQTMAILHNRNPFGKTHKNSNFGTLVEEIFDRYAGIRGLNLPKTIEDAHAEFLGVIGRYGLVVKILNNVSSQVECDNENVVDEILQPVEMGHNEFSKLKREMQDVRQIVSNDVEYINRKSSLCNAIVKVNHNDDLYISYGKYVLGKMKNCDNLDLEKFSYSVTKEIMGQVYYKNEVYPFKHLDNVSVRDLWTAFGKMETDLQEAFIKVVLKDEVTNSLIQDIKRYDELDDTTKGIVAKLSSQDEKLNSILTVKKRKLEKEKNKDIRRLVRLSSRDDSYYGLARTNK